MSLVENAKFAADSTAHDLLMPIFDHKPTPTEAAEYAAHETYRKYIDGGCSAHEARKAYCEALSYYLRHSK